MLCSTIAPVLCALLDTVPYKNLIPGTSIIERRALRKDESVPWREEKLKKSIDNLKAVIKFVTCGAAAASRTALATVHVQEALSRSGGSGTVTTVLLAPLRQPHDLAGKSIRNQM
jgi:hypothetical protein